MAAKNIDMQTLKQIIQLRISGLGIKTIADTLGMSKNTVKKYIRVLEAQEASLDKILNYSEEKLASIFNLVLSGDSKRYQELREWFPYMDKELKRVGVTREVLWHEYKNKHADGYNYSRFCYYYQQWRKADSVSMHFEHKAGDKLFVDYTGKKLEVVDKRTGEVQQVEVLITVLGASQLTYVEATATQQKVDFIRTVENSLHYFGGVPKAIVVDNLKSAVTKSSKFEATINRTFADFASHYGTVILPTRSYKPKDKALVENAVKIVYTRIFAPLRNRIFFSLTQLNTAIKEALENYNSLAFQGKDYSRKDCFEKVEKNTLLPLNIEKYQLKQYNQVTVLQNSHIYLREDKHYYSVPFRFVGKRVGLRYTATSVEISYNYKRIACHNRDMRHYKYTTSKEHLPSHHQFVSKWNPEYFINWATKIGSYTQIYISELIQSRAHPEQAYKSCVGILGMSRKVGNNRLEAACKRGHYYQSYSYPVIKRILDQHLDKEPVPEQEKQKQARIPFHQNIRGKDYYQ
jgi:transposase